MVSAYFPHKNVTFYACYGSWLNAKSTILCIPINYDVSFQQSRGSQDCHLAKVPYRNITHKSHFLKKILGPDSLFVDELDSFWYIDMFRWPIKIIESARDFTLNTLFHCSRVFFLMFIQKQMAACLGRNSIIFSPLLWKHKAVEVLLIITYGARHPKDEEERKALWEARGDI